jgi:hypothetical protein
VTQAYMRLGMLQCDSSLKTWNWSPKSRRLGHLVLLLTMCPKFAQLCDYLYKSLNTVPVEVTKLSSLAANTGAIGRLDQHQVTNSSVIARLHVDRETRYRVTMHVRSQAKIGGICDLWLIPRSG